MVAGCAGTGGLYSFFFSSFGFLARSPSFILLPFSPAFDLLFFSRLSVAVRSASSLLLFSCVSCSRSVAISLSFLLESASCCILALIYVSDFEIESGQLAVKCLERWWRTGGISERGSERRSDVMRETRLSMYEAISLWESMR